MAARCAYGYLPLMSTNYVAALNKSKEMNHLILKTANKENSRVFLYK